MSNYELFGTRNGPFYVADTDRRVRPASNRGRQHFARYPMSQFYDIAADAAAVQTWLIEREAGYPQKHLPWPEWDRPGSLRV